MKKPSKRKPKIKARKVWGLKPITKVFKDKSKLPFRKRKHKENLHVADE
jgi:hypothetical protein